MVKLVKLSLLFSYLYCISLFQGHSLQNNYSVQILGYESDWEQFYESPTGVSREGTLGLPSVSVSDYPSVHPSTKSGSCDNLKTVWSLLMKLGKWIDEKVEIMHNLLFCLSTVNFGCYVNLFLFH